MGLAADEDAWKIAALLAAPVSEEDDMDALFALAERSRLDLAAARKNVTLLADALGVTRRFRYLGAIEIGVDTERETDRSRLTGPTLSLELPLFNQGKGKVARSQAQLALAEAELRELEIAISNGVRRAAAEIAAARQRAEHYRTSLIPLREAIVARTQEQVNYMLVGQFELLLAKQQEYDAYQGYLEAVRDYWLARVELAREVGTRLPSSAQATGEELTAPKGGGMQMHHQGMEGMDHDMPGMEPSGDAMKAIDHSSHGGVSRKKIAPRRDEGPSDMPTGMESHIPEPAEESDPAPNPSGETETQQHGDHP
jgi:outer membrane protein, heavy metal efflux system